jgi:hypothetical protein
MAGTIRNFIYLAVAIAMVLYALPRIEFGQSWTFSTVFGIVWLGFAFIVISAQLYLLFGVKEQTKRRLAQIRRERAVLWERRMQQSLQAQTRYRRSKQ